MTEIAMQLADLIDAGIDAEAPVDQRTITGLTSDSRAVTPGSLFAALAGSRTDGARFVADAIAKGAVAVLTGRGAPLTVPGSVAVLRATEPRRALALKNALSLSAPALSLIAESHYAK